MSTLLNADIRSQSKPYKRDNTQKAKWAKGGIPVPGRCQHRDPFCTQCTDTGSKPFPGPSKNYSHMRQNERKKLSGQASSLARKVFRNEVVQATDGPLANVNSDSSENEDVKDASAAPEADAEVMYSFDNKNGPTRGNDVLSLAVTQAILRFEENETKKLVKNEYDVVEDEEVEHYDADEDDDFEMIEYTHLK